MFTPNPATLPPSKYPLKYRAFYRTLTDEKTNVDQTYSWNGTDIKKRVVPSAGAVIIPGVGPGWTKQLLPMFTIACIN